MSRPVEYPPPLPRGVKAIAIAIVADYPRRSRGDATRACLELNRAVDEALMWVEECYRAPILADIIARRGWERSRARDTLYERGYYARRNLVLRKVAEELNLI